MYDYYYDFKQTRLSQGDLLDQSHVANLWGNWYSNSGSCPFFLHPSLVPVAKNLTLSTPRWRPAGDRDMSAKYEASQFLLYRGKWVIHCSKVTEGKNTCLCLREIIIFVTHSAFCLVLKFNWKLVFSFCDCQMTKRSAALLWALQPIHEGYFTWQGSCFNGKGCHILFTSWFWSHCNRFAWILLLSSILFFPRFFF